MLGRLYLERKDTAPRDRVAGTRRRSAGADPRCRPRAPLRSGEDARIGRRAFARARGLRRARIRIGRLSRRRRPDRTALQGAGSRLASVQAAPFRRPPARNGVAPGADPVVGLLGAQLLRRSGQRPSGPLLTSNYTRGAITGLGLLNVWAALAELADLFGSRKSDDPHPTSIRIPKSAIRNDSVPGHRPPPAGRGHGRAPGAIGSTLLRAAGGRGRLAQAST